MIFEKDLKESQDHFQELLKLIEQNPGVPVFPIVDENICDSIEFNVIFNLCKFEMPYMMKYCYYALDSEKTEMYSEWSMSDLEIDATKRGIKIEWKDAIFIPISVCER